MPEMLRQWRRVEGLFCFFVPLMVETLGLWTPYSRGMMYKIAMKMTLHMLINCSSGGSRGNSLYSKELPVPQDWKSSRVKKFMNFDVTKLCYMAIEDISRVPMKCALNYTFRWPMAALSKEDPELLDKIK